MTNSAYAILGHLYHADSVQSANHQNGEAVCGQEIESHLRAGQQQSNLEMILMGMFITGTLIQSLLVETVFLSFMATES